MHPGSKHDIGATYVGIIFLNTIFVEGKGVIMFALFGLGYETVIEPFFQWCKALKSLDSRPPKETEEEH